MNHSVWRDTVLPPQRRIFLGFFGITRSLRHTIGSIRDNIYAPLARSGMGASRYGHFHLPEMIDNRRSGEAALPVDPLEYQLLELDHHQQDPQEPSLIAAPLAIARQYPDPYQDNYVSMRNLCFQLRSLHRLWDAIAPALTDSDWVVFLRPDLFYLHQLDVAALIDRMAGDGADLAVPAWQSWGGLNDRFAIANARGARFYATRLHLLRDALEAIPSFRAERLLAYAAARESLVVGQLSARALRIRANGHAAGNDLIDFGMADRETGALIAS
jgi:hypothetical protein